MKGAEKDTVILAGIILGAIFLLKDRSSTSAISGNRTIRSRVYDYDELPEDQKIEHLDNSDSSFVKDPTHKGEFLPLNMFMRFDRKNKLWDGYYGTSAFSAYYIKLSKDGEEAVVADRWN